MAERIPTAAGDNFALFALNGVANVMLRLAVNAKSFFTARFEGRESRLISGYFLLDLLVTGLVLAPLH